MKFRYLMQVNLLGIVAAVGCHGQAVVTPAPTASISNSPATCPNGYTCGYIVSRASCATASSCPTPGNPGPGPYTALQTPTTALTSPNFTDPAPPTGVYVAYTEQVVYTNLSPPWTGPPSPASTPQLVALYPGTLAAPSVTMTAELAPTLSPDTLRPQMAFQGAMPAVARPQVKIVWK
jgi:hypothetical protein